MGNLMPKPSFFEEQQWGFLTYCCGDKGVYNFSKGICLNVNIIAWLQFDLSKYELVVQRCNH